MNGPFHIRGAVPADAETIAAFNSAMSIETEDIVLPDENALPGAATVLDDPSLGFYLVTEVDGEIAGSLMITYEWSDWSNAMYWWIQSVYVHGRVLEMAREDGNVRGIKLYVFYGNESAQSTYESLGMHRSEHHIYEVAVRPGEKSRG